MPITSLHFTNIGPFEEAEFEFDDHVNVLVGPNNAGKSATLIALGNITIYPFDFPKKLLRGKEQQWDAVVRRGSRKRRFRGVLPLNTHAEGVLTLLKQVGYIRLSRRCVAAPISGLRDLWWGQKTARADSGRES